MNFSVFSFFFSDGPWSSEPSLYCDPGTPTPHRGRLLAGKWNSFEIHTALRYLYPMPLYNWIHGLKVAYFTIYSFSNQQKTSWLWKKAWWIWTKNKQFKEQSVYLKFNLVDMNRVKGSEVDLSFGSAVHKSDTLTTEALWYLIELIETKKFTKHLILWHCSINSISLDAMSFLKTLWGTSCISEIDN